MVLDTLRQITIEPIISYPHQALAGKTYLMTIDLRMRTPPADWPYENEEYAISFILDTMPFFAHEPVSEEDPTVILHRFGGTYGPATFLLTASQKEMSGTIRITFVNDSGIPVERVELKCEVSDVMIERPVVAKKRFEARVPTQSSSETGSEVALQSGDGMSNALDVSNEDEMRIEEDNTASTFKEARYGTDQITAQPPVPTIEKPKSTQESRDRRWMLAKVRSFWIDEVLEESLHGTAPITPGLHLQRDAVANPSVTSSQRLILQQQNQSPSSLPSGTHITQVFDNVNGELLIIGEPGSGKTTLLLELTRDLLDRAQKNTKRPIPVVFNLSSWAIKRQPLIQWLIEELNVKYQIPRKVGQQWVDADQLLVLLDGLDEVASEHREACIDAINKYRRNHGQVPLVVCSRSTEYMQARLGLLLQSAVVVQPLTREQIEEYLISGGEQLAGVRKAFDEDKELQELATTPLMLSIITLAYAGIPAEQLSLTGSLAARREQVFARYVERMLARRRHDSRYKPEQTIKWLSWLAKEMQQRNQTVFSIEQIQLFRRFRLWSNGAIPFNLKPFLDFAVECVFLRKVGPNGYCFVHRLLEDYFASLEMSPLDQGRLTEAPG